MFVNSIVLALNSPLYPYVHRHRNHGLGSSARLRARSDPHLVLQQTAGAEEHRAHDVQGHGLVVGRDRDGDCGESCYKLYIVCVCMCVCVYVVYVCVLCDSFKHLAFRV